MSKHFLILCAVAAGLCFPGASAAQSTFVVPVNRMEPTAIANPATGDLVRFGYAFDRSYCCTIESNYTNLGARFSAVTTSTSTAYPYEKRGDDEAAAWNLGTSTDSDAERVCFSGINSTAFTSLRLTLAFDIEPVSVSANVWVQCSETTLFGGFNTSVTDYNFLELTNTSGTAITVNVIGWNSITGSTTPVVNLSALVPANRRLDIDIHSLVGSGVYGSLLVKHDGAPGSLRAVLNQYNITSTNGDFAPVNTLEFKTRKQLAVGGN